MSEAAILGIFAKQPVPGNVKTRLCPPLTPRQAADLYLCSLRETVRLARQGAWSAKLFYRGERRFFSDTFPGLPLEEQTGADLGGRLAAAFASLFAGGAQKVVIIGSDSPDLPPSLLKEAFAGLDSHDAVLAPADDGGYVLIGLRRPAPAIFTGIPWSTDEVLTATRKHLAGQHLTCLELCGWHDVDDVAGLRQLMRRSPLSVTARLAAQLLGAAHPE
jgi:rSAM/selenodomain-associated transferase 1